MCFFKQSRYEMCLHDGDDKILSNYCGHRLLLRLLIERASGRIAHQKLKSLELKCKDLTTTTKFSTDGKCPGCQQDERLAREHAERRAQERVEIGALFRELFREQGEEEEIDEEEVDNGQGDREEEVDTETEEANLDNRDLQYPFTEVEELLELFDEIQGFSGPEGRDSAWYPLSPISNIATSPNPSNTAAVWPGRARQTPYEQIWDRINSFIYQMRPDILHHINNYSYRVPLEYEPGSANAAK